MTILEAEPTAASARVARVEQPYLSIIIPAYNEERRLPATLSEVHRFVQADGRPAEVIVAENGSVDGTAEVVREFQSSHPYVHLINHLPKGKGLAVREGMLAARGRYRFLCDADLSMPLSYLPAFLVELEHGADVAIGSREIEGAERIGEPYHRHLMGRIYAAVVKLMALPGFEDTQCGFKCFTAQAAGDCFERARLTGWGFDPEVLYIARKLDYRVVEVPIEWHYNPDSRVRPISDALQMVRDVLLIRWMDWRGAYDG
jgi:glycosyltransferase involved in cell wall biosynthesis